MWHVHDLKSSHVDPKVNDGGDLYIDDYSLFAPVSNKEDEDMQAYMMRPDVRAALHVEEAPTSTWPYSDVGFDYHKQYELVTKTPKTVPGV